MTSAVRELLTSDDLDTLACQAVTGYRCVICSEPGELDVSPATVVVRLVTPDDGGVAGPLAAHVRLAHQRCSPSKVIHDPGTMTVPAETGVRATAVILPAGLRHRALLIVEPSSSLVSITAGGERQDLLTAELLGLGMSLVSTPWERAPEASGWLVWLPSRAEAIVCDPGGDVIYEGELDQPRSWRQVTRGGQVELLVGSVGLPALEGDPSAGLQALEEAARQGRMVGATVAVRRGGQ